MKGPASIPRAGPVVVALLLVTSPLLAQVDVTGHVLQEGTGQPIDRAVVTVEGRSGGVVTDSTGAFAIEGLPTGLFRFRIERLGYWTTVVPVELERSTDLLFHVAANPIVADRIEVVYDVLEGRRNAVPFAVRTYGPERLSAHVALDLEEFVRRRAGLHLVRCRGNAFGPPVAGPPACLPHRGRTVPVRVWIDESPVFGGLDALFGYDVVNAHSVEVLPGCGMIRVYTRQFMESVAAGRHSLFPVIPECTS